MQKRAKSARRRWGITLMIAGLLAPTLTESIVGVGFGRGCDGAIEDGAGRAGVVAANAVAETPAGR